MNYNRVMLGGTMTRDIELRYSPKGTAIGKFGLAINRRWKNDAGEQKEEATFVDVDCFGKTAETISQHLKKGSGIFIEGRLKLDQWEDKTSGQKRSKLGVVLDSFQFVGKKSDESDTTPPQAPINRSPAPKAQPGVNPKDEAALQKELGDIKEDDVPF